MSFPRRICSHLCSLSKYMLDEHLNEPCDFQVRQFGLARNIASIAPHVTPHVTPHVAPHVERLLRVMTGEMSRQDLMAALNLADRMHFSKEYLREALSHELIEMTLPQKPRSVSQKYRLTDKGRRLLKKQGGAA